MKLSFSLPSSKSSSKSNSIKPSQTFDDSSTKQDLSTKSKHLITEFDPSKPSSLPTFKTLIPPIENQWRPTKKMKNLDLPLTEAHGSDSLTFERDTSSATDQPGSDMSYGLNVRRSNNDQQSDDVDGNGVLLKRRVNVEDSMLKKLKDDLERLPDDQGFDEFKDVPVEGFGAALLAGYGWSEGMGIGKNAKEDVKVVEYKRRTAKEGLGFVGDAPPSKKEKREDKKGAEKGKKDEKVVRIVGGRDAGLKGSVVSKIGVDYLVLKLLGVGEQVKVKVDDVAELGSAEEERCLKKLMDLKIQQQRDEEKRSKSRHGRDEEKRSKSRHGRDEEKRSKSRRESDEEKGSKSRRGSDEVEVKRVNGSGRREGEGKKQVSWLTSHIRVRVISRNFKGGRLYLKKGEVLDVVDPTTCDITMDESREIVQGVSQEYLETAIPRRGGAVLVLYGKHKGAFGSLVERDSDRGVGIVRDADTHELLNVKLEQIAEYIGDPSLLGH